MSREEDLALLRRAVQSTGFAALNPPEGYEAWSFYLKLDVGYAFVCLVGDDEDLRSVWPRAQDQVGKARDNWLIGDYLPDLYLVLIYRGTLDPQDWIAQAIQRDPYICHKAVAAWPAGVQPEQVLSALPFWPLPMPTETAGAVPPVADLLVPQGYSLEWVQQLLQPGRSHEVIARALGEGQLVVRRVDGVQGNGGEAAQWPNNRRSVANRWRIGNVEIDGFRGFARPFQIDLDAALVVVYAPNGTGKTSLCEALEWALTRQVKRVARPGADAPEQAEPPILHVHSNRARVALTLRSGTATRSIEISYDRGAAHAVWRIGGRLAPTDREGIRLTLDARLPERAGAAWIREAFRCYHFLEQEAGYRFLREAGPADRYEFYQILTQTTEYAVAEERAQTAAKELERLASEWGDQIAEQKARLNTATTELNSLKADIHTALEQVTGTAVQAIQAEAITLATDLGIAPPGAATAGAPLTLAEVLAGPLASAQASAESIQAELDRLPEAHADAARRRERLAAIARDLDSLAPVRASLEEERRAIAERSARLSEAVQELNREISSLEQRRTSVQRYKDLQARLQPLGGTLTALQTTWERATRLRVRTSALEAVRAFLAAGATLADLERRQADVRAAYDLRGLELDSVVPQDEAARLSQETEAGQVAVLRVQLSERNRLLAQLQAHVDSEHCPLCRTRFTSIKALREAVQESLHVVPPALLAAEQRLQKLNEAREALQKRVAETRAAVADLADQLRDIDQQIGQQQLLLQRYAEKVRELLGGAAPDNALLGRLKSEVASLQTESVRDEEVASALLQQLHLALGDGGTDGGTSGWPESPEAALERGQIVFDSWQAEAQALRLTDDERAAPETALRDLDQTLQACANRQSEQRQQQAALERERDQTDRRVSTALEQEEQLVKQRLEHQSALDALDGKLQRLGCPASASLPDVERVRQAGAEQLQRLHRLGQVIDLLRVHGRVLASSRRSHELQHDIATGAEQVRRLQQEKERYDALVRECREFAADTGRVRAQLEHDRESLYLPMVNHLYQRLSVHPYFGDLSLDVDPENGAFRVQVRHPETKQPVGALADYYSTAQMHIAALSIFFTQALLQGWSSLSTIILDDPVQHLDDINTHAFLDLLRSLVSTDRQIVVTTCNRELYKLMLVEFASLNRKAGGARDMPFRAFRLQGIGRDGPARTEDNGIISAIVRRQATALR